MRSVFAALLLGLPCSACLLMTPGTLEERRVHDVATAIRSERPEESARGVEDARQVASKIGLCGCGGGVVPTAEATRALDTEAIPALVARLEDPREEVRTTAAHALHRLTTRPGSDGRPPRRPTVDMDAVLRAIRDPALEEAVSVLGCVEPLPDRVVPEVVAVFARQGPAALYAGAVLAHGGVASRRPLIDALAAEDHRRWMASTVLRGVALSDEEASRVLDVVLASADPEIHGSGFSALQSSVRPGAPVLGRLVLLLEDPRPSVRSEAAYLLPRGGEPMRAHLPRLEALLVADGSRGAAHAIADLGSTDSMAPTLARVVEDPASDPRVRASCLQALGRLGPRARAYLPLIQERIENADDMSERNAAHAARDLIRPVGR